MLLAADKVRRGRRVVAKHGRGGMVINIPRNYDRYSRDRNGNSAKAIRRGPARYDVATDAWVRDTYEYTHSLGPGITNEEFEVTVEVIRFYPIKSVNASGFLFTIDELDGDEAKRARYLSFCLTNNVTVLCGSGNAPIMLLLEGNKADSTNFLKKIVESIEGLDDKTWKKQYQGALGGAMIPARSMPWQSY